MEFDVRVCQECHKAFDEPAQARRHFRVHGMSLEQYWLKWKHGGVRPNCACGCGGQPAWNVALKDYAAYVHGHHMTGREQPAETRRKIGEKNAVNMKRFMDANPEFARAKGIQLRAARTPESELRRLEATRTTYAAMSVDDKRQFSDHAKELWQDGTLKEAHDKASTTWKKRYDAGKYDFTERNERLSQSITQKYLDGVPFDGPGVVVQTDDGEEVAVSLDHVVPGSKAKYYFPDDEVDTYGRDVPNPYRRMADRNALGHIERG